MQTGLVDVSSAYFNALVDEARPTYVEIPPEHPIAGQRVCSFRRRHMYGTQRAADGWQCEYSATLRELGFVQGIGSPCVFYHSSRDIVTSVHGDDFTGCGPNRQLDWFETTLVGHYELSKGAA